MAKSEELLQELVELKKKQMKRTRNNRILKFTFATLPAFLLIIISIYGGFQLAQKSVEFLENLPELMEGQLGEQIENQREALQL